MAKKDAKTVEAPETTQADGKKDNNKGDFLNHIHKNLIKDKTITKENKDGEKYEKAVKQVSVNVPDCVEGQMGHFIVNPGQVFESKKDPNYCNILIPYGKDNQPGQVTVNFPSKDLGDGKFEYSNISATREDLYNWKKAADTAWKEAHPKEKAAEAEAEAPEAEDVDDFEK